MSSSSEPDVTTASDSARVDMTRFIPLVTGGGSGIGLGLVKEFLKRGAPKVLLTGRRESVLQEAANELIRTFGSCQAEEEKDKEKKSSIVVAYKVSDAGNEQDRQALLEWVQENHPDCNALFNNAGIQRRIALAEDTAPWSERASEIEINLNGPIHLCTLFVPFFLQKQQQCYICNVTSGLAFVPFPPGPVYAATKAALHSYTVALRYSLEPVKDVVKVVELVPPAVKTNLGGSHDFGEELDEFCVHAVDQFQRGEQDEFGYKFSEVARNADRNTIHSLMVNMSKNMQVKQYGNS